MVQQNVPASAFSQCILCPRGEQGPPGLQGPQGIPGRDGRDALLVSYAGSEKEHGTHTDPPPEPKPSGTAGVTYTRWGRSSCPEGAELIYDGVMAGSHYTHGGGAANYLCLTMEPTFHEHATAGYQSQAYIYGTEYETGNSKLLPGLQDFEAPCAVCLAPSKTASLMVPGTNKCQGGKDWKLEYKGFIMSEHHTHARTEYICVDSEAKGISRSHGDHNGALLCIAEVVCASGGGGGIPCPPYTDGFELTCAVCTL